MDGIEPQGANIPPEQNPMTPNKKPWWILIIVVAVALLAFASVGVYVFFVSTDRNGEGIACTADARLCPDGSAVGRVGPDCEFAECPISESSSLLEVEEIVFAGTKNTEDWQEFQNSNLGLALSHPLDWVESSFSTTTESGTYYKNSFKKNLTSTRYLEVSVNGPRTVSEQGIELLSLELRRIGELPVFFQEFHACLGEHESTLACSLKRIWYPEETDIDEIRRIIGSKEKIPMKFFVTYGVFEDARGGEWQWPESQNELRSIFESEEAGGSLGQIMSTFALVERLESKVYSERVENISESDLIPISDSLYKDETSIYFSNEGFYYQLLKSDPDSFRLVGAMHAIDNGSAYILFPGLFSGITVKPFALVIADGTFEEIEISAAGNNIAYCPPRKKIQTLTNFSKTSSHVYFNDRVLADLKPEHFKIYGGGSVPPTCQADHIYVGDRETIYYIVHFPWGAVTEFVKIEEVDPATFTILHDQYARDKNNMYLKGIKVEEEDF